MSAPDLASAPPVRPFAPWVRLLVAAVVAAVVLAAGYLRFDAGASGTGRLLLATIWMPAAFGAHRLFRRVQPLAARYGEEPGGRDALIEELNGQRRAAWAAARRWAYVLQAGGWVGLVLWTVLYTTVAFLPKALIAERPLGAMGPFGFLQWAALIGVGTWGLGFWWARRTWERAERAWPRDSVSPSA
jgi:hypothetical protein